MQNPLLTISDLLSDVTGNTMHYTAPPLASSTKPTVPPVDQARVDKIRNSLGSVETAGVQSKYHVDPYAFSQPSGSKTLGKALGKYQVTEGLLKQLAPVYLKQPVTSQQFLSNPSLQDSFMSARISHLLAQGFTPQQIADMHNGGVPLNPVPGSTTYQKPQYVQKFNDVYNAPDPRNFASLNQ